MEKLGYGRNLLEKLQEELLRIFRSVGAISEPKRPAIHSSLQLFFRDYVIHPVTAQA